VHAHASEVDPARDELELAVLDRAWGRRVPILGLCRGAQLMAVHRGGTLVPDIADACAVPADTHQYGSARDELVRHEVALTMGSRVQRILGARRIGVNSRHHQAVRDAGDGLVVTGHDLDTPTPHGDLVEAIEAEDPTRWAIGVQWHPENLVRRTDAVGAAALKLFAGLVAAALAFASSHTRLSATG
jgi:putative glutamine amidotransferase